MELTSSGSSLASLGQEFEPPKQTIQNWVRQADVDDVDERFRSDRLTTEARRERSRLKREQGMTHGT